MKDFTFFFKVGKHTWKAGNSLYMRSLLCPPRYSLETQTRSWRRIIQKKCYIGYFETESVIMWLSPSSCHQDSKYFLCLKVKAHSSSPLCLPYNTLPLAVVMCCLLPLCGWKCSSSMQHKNCSPSLLNLLQNGKISFCERRKCQ